MEDAFLYGCWKGRRLERSAPEDLPKDALDALAALADFNPGNPVTSLFGPQGFLMLPDAPALPEALLAYCRKARDLSCGRCTPCRAGTVLICEALQRAVAGEGDKVDWDAVLDIARRMQATSLCGVGLSTVEPVIRAIECFPEALRTHEPAQEPSEGLAGRIASVLTAPCIEACPAHVNVPRYIDFIRDGRPEMAEGVLLKRYPLVGACGRVCVRPCEAACARRFVDAPVAIKDLKRHAADHAGASVAELFTPEDGAAARGETPAHLVAVVGAGPAGLSCAYHLLRRGHAVDVIDMEREAGGMARWGIPSYRLPRARLAAETDVVKSLGGRFRFGEKLGVDFSVSDLFEEGYEAVFLGVGCALGQYLGLPGEDESAAGYLKGLDFLLEVERSQGGPKGPAMLEGDTVVVGCGNVAMDCCRVAQRLRKDPGNGRVVVAYRRTEASAPADPEEIHAARDEGVEFEFLAAPKRILVEDGRVTGIELVRMRETESDASGRRGVEAVPGSEHVIPCSRVIAAIGQKVDTSAFAPEDGIRLTRSGTIETREDFTTSRRGVFAGGDAAVGAKTLILAMAHGEGAAKSIDAFLRTGEPAFSPRRRMGAIIRETKLLDACRPAKPVPEAPRHRVVTLESAHRVCEGRWSEVEAGMTAPEAWSESKRCMRCYRLVALTTRDPIPRTLATTPQTPLL